MCVALYVLLQVARIQNPSLYLKYMVDKQQMEKRCGDSTVIERLLYHGTSEDAIQKINSQGFDRGYCGKNGLYIMFSYI